MKITCYCHPGGRTELDESEFAPSDRTRESAPCRKCRARLERERTAAKKAGTYTPKHRRYSPQRKAVEQPATPEPITAELITTHTFVKIGGYFVAERAILLADTLQDGKVTLFTTILEIDGETKHPRNKKLIFTRQHAPEEYSATIAWLNSSAGVPTIVEPTMNEQAAMQLAEEATERLKTANKEISDLKAKLAQFRALLNGVPE